MVDATDEWAMFDTWYSEGLRLPGVPPDLVGVIAVRAAVRRGRWWIDAGAAQELIRRTAIKTQ